MRRSQTSKVQYASQYEVLSAVMNGCSSDDLFIKQEAFRALRGFPPSVEKYDTIRRYGLVRVPSVNVSDDRAYFDAVRWPKDKQPFTEEQKKARFDFIDGVLPHSHNPFDTVVGILAAIMCLFDSGEEEDLLFIEELANWLDAEKTADLPNWIVVDTGYAPSITDLFIHMIYSKQRGSIPAEAIKEWYTSGNALLKKAAVAAIGTVYELTWDADDVEKIDVLIRRGEYPSTPFPYIDSTEYFDFAPCNVIDLWLGKIDELIGPHGTKKSAIKDKSKITTARQYAFAILNFSRAFDVAGRAHSLPWTSEEDILRFFNRIADAFVRTNLISAKTFCSNGKYIPRFWGIEPMELFMEQPLIKMKTIASWAFSQKRKWQIAAIYACAGRELSDGMAAWLLDNFFNYSRLGDPVERVFALSQSIIHHKTAKPPVLPKNALADAVVRALYLCIGSEDKNYLYDEWERFYLNTAFNLYPKYYYYDYGRDDAMWGINIPKSPRIPMSRVEQWLKSSERFLVDVAMECIDLAMDDGEIIPENIIAIISKRRSKKAKELTAKVLDYKTTLTSPLRHASRENGRPDPETLQLALQHEDDSVRAVGIAAFRPYLVPRNILEYARKSNDETIQQAVMTACRDYCYKVKPDFSVDMPI